LGCKFYSLVYKEKAQYCPGEVCEIKDRQEIQKTSKTQLLIVLGAVVYMVLIVAIFSDFYSVPPYDLFGLEGGMH
jgi:hypothetical protein